MKLVMYTRVSSKAQVKDGYGLAIQEKDCRAWAKANGHKVVQHCSDDAVKGALPAEERPGLQCALRAVRDGTADGIICGKLDRLARALTTQEAVLALVWRDRPGGRPAGRVFTADIGEILPDDPDDPMRTAMRQMMGVFAQLDKSLAVQRMRNGRLAKAAAGRHAVGVYPYGYRAGGEGRERDAVPDEAEQQAVELVGRMRREGRSYREITGALERDGIPPRSGRRWYPSTVRKIALRLEESP
jgi:DNA invertase Pin-like site-specific DNA recombinase